MKAAIVSLLLCEISGEGHQKFLKAPNQCLPLAASRSLNESQNSEIPLNLLPGHQLHARPTHHP